MDKQLKTADGPLGAEELRLIDAYWRATLYLCVGMIFLKDNPLLLDFDSRETAIIEQYLDLFGELGFALEMIGPNTLRLTEMPADVPAADARGFLEDILTLIQNSREPSAAALRHAYLQTAACRGAVKAGDALNMRQLQALVGELSITALPYTCPHGRPTIIKFTAAELAKMFKRS